MGDREKCEFKIKRNTNVINDVPQDYKEAFIAHITWSNAMIEQLDTLYYQDKSNTVERICSILDYDYASIEFEIEKQSSFKSK